MTENQRGDPWVKKIFFSKMFSELARKIFEIQEIFCWLPKLKKWLRKILSIKTYSVRIFSNKKLWLHCSSVYLRSENQNWKICTIWSRTRAPQQRRWGGVLMYNLVLYTRLLGNNIYSPRLSTSIKPKFKMNTIAYRLVDIKIRDILLSRF